MIHKTLLLAFAGIAAACSSGPTAPKQEIDEAAGDVPYELAMVDEGFDAESADVEQEESDEELRRSFKVGAGGFKKKKQELKEKFDADGDDKLSKDERVAACEAGKKKLQSLAETKPEKAKKARAKICGFAKRKADKLEKKNIPLTERPALKCVIDACNGSTKSGDDSTAATDASDEGDLELE